MSIKEILTLLTQNELNKNEFYLKTGTATDIDLGTFTFTPNEYIQGMKQPGSVHPTVYPKCQVG